MAAIAKHLQAKASTGAVVRSSHTKLFVEAYTDKMATASKSKTTEKQWHV